MKDLFVFTASPWELMLRATVMFWFLFLIFRFVLRRDVGSVGVSDFLFVVILGDATQNAMVGESHSIVDGMVVVGTLVAWNIGLDALTYYVPWFERFANAKRLCLYRDGKFLRRNMRKEFITEQELEARLHREGLEHFEQVKAMFMESDGEISVIQK